MAMSDRAVEYTLQLRRPAEVKEWSDLDAVLIEYGDRLLHALGPGWEVEGPNYDLGIYYVSATRTLTTEPRERHVEVSLGMESSSDPLPPDLLRFRVFVADEEDTPVPSDVVANAVTGFVMACSAATGFAVWRATRGVVLPVLAAGGALLGLLVLSLVLQEQVNRLRARRRPTPPRSDVEFRAAVAAVERVFPTAARLGSG
jgi:hypothetical protein